ncbi:MAG: hypothetical protein JWP97_3488 [Labilithrix sp.]|nr:hypothetical protein [Labilithrix sp.]
MLRDTCPDLGDSQDLWRVWLAGGERTMSLEMLDALFEDGVITVDTQVCPPDGATFARLGEIAGLDEEPSVDVDMSLPVAADSMRPVAMSLDLGAEMAALKPRWSFKKLLLVPAVASVLGLVALAASAGASAPSVGAAAVRTEIAAPIVTAAAPQPVVTPAPVAAPAPAAPVLSDAQKKALAARDKKAEAAAAAKARRAAGAAPRKGAGAAKSSSPFSKGGSAHDPLNGSL